MIRSMAVLVSAAMIAGGASAKGGGLGGGYYVTVVPASQPGDNCIATGVASGQESRTADGKLVLVDSVHGVDTRRCPNTSFPIWATTQKVPPDELRNFPSTQCVPQGARVLEEVHVPSFGLATVLQLLPLNTQCPGSRTKGGREAIVISTAAYRASRAAQAPEPAASQPQSTAASASGLTEAQIRREYERLLAGATPVEEYHVRHLLVRTREEAASAGERIKSGQAFADVAADVSIDPSSRLKGGDLGWKVPTSFIEEFSKTMVSLKPAGLATQPTRTRFGWHLIEVLEVKIGKNSFPSYLDVKDRIESKLMRDAHTTTKRVGIAAVCRKMVAPEIPAEAVRGGISGTVVAELRVENGKVAEIISLTGPTIFHPAVTTAVHRYECDHFDFPVNATQSFNFKSLTN